MTITIYQAKLIHTMNPANPTATHIAVRDGAILGVGTLEELVGWGEYELDQTFADHVIIPGFVEAHAHVMAAGMMRLPYMGFFSRKRADGSIAPGIGSYAELLDALRAENAAMEAAGAGADVPLVAVGFDPIYFKDEPRLTRHHLDQVTTNRGIYLQHASGHLATVNTLMLEQNQVTKDSKIEGIGRDADGELDGELREPAAMASCRTGARITHQANATEEALLDFAAMARNVGVTTVTDLAGQSLLVPKLKSMWLDVTAREDFPARIVQYNLPAIPGASADFAQVAEQFVALKNESQERLRFPGVKFVLDGSIQGYSALLKPPGYIQGEDHGQLLTVPEQFVDWLRPFHNSSLSVHMHCNGNLTQDLAIDTVEKVLREDPMARSPPHHHPRAVNHPSTTKAHGQNGYLRQLLQQSPLVLGRPTL